MSEVTNTVADVIPNHNISRVYFSISEVTQLLDVSYYDVSRWIKLFNLNVVRKGKNGRYRISLDDYATLKTIRHLIKVECYTIKGVKKRLGQS